MRALDSRGALSLGELQEATGIGKSTLSRILLTLQKERLAAQRIIDRKWVAGPGIGSTDQRDTTPNLLVQAAAPELTKLCERVIWPSDLSVRSGLRMVLVETSRPHTRLMFNKLAVGFEIDFLLSAPGRAYLAFCPERERNDILSKLRKRSHYNFLFESDQMDNILKEVRKQGFGHRDSRWGGRSHEFRKAYDDGLDAIAVPIMYQDVIMGCVNVVWIRSILSRRSAVTRYLDDLKEASRAIAGAYAFLAD